MDVTVRSWLWLAAMAVVATLGGVSSVFVVRHIVDEQPMPCTSAEVYVWVDYPEEAHCVSSTDHSQHEGH